MSGGRMSGGGMSGGRPSGARVAVVVASSGRPAALAGLSRRLALQTHLPHRVVFSVTGPADLPEPGALHPGAEVLTGPPGLPAQRNRGLQAVLAESDAVAFFDDDYVPSIRALEGIAGFFARHPGHVGINGHLIADGINSPGIPYDEAVALVEAHDRAPPPPHEGPGRDLHGLYGCNMAFRAAAIGAARFDERLPLYGWQEDIDFAAQLLPRGRLARTRAFVGVHCGLKGGRTSGLRLGYSQVANPLYLARKGTMRRGYALKLIARNLAANHARALAQEPWIDRRGRLLGNWRALRDAALGRADPGNILLLGAPGGAR
jgi:hypothetical protein